MPGSDSAADHEPLAIAPEDLPQSASETPDAPRVRQDFPETLLWRPELVTDDQGRVELEFPVADSITRWRVLASAVTRQGRLGSHRDALTVFQPFFADIDLPVALTRGDTVALPVVVYNYLDQPQTVQLELRQDDWFELTGNRTQQVELAAGDVRSVRFQIRAAQVGNHTLQVTARGGELADALERSIEVIPDGQRVELVHSGRLHPPAANPQAPAQAAIKPLELIVPQDAIPGSVRAQVKLYPSSFSQLVDGLDGILRRPSGCFEQTSSTTYPNVLALNYLRRTGKSLPAIELKARQYIHLGYQRLLGFEVPSSGFSWYGRAPADVRLTAYGLMEFTDMAEVYDVDPNLIRRTRDWLMRQQQADGSWGDPRDPQRNLMETAYVAWAVYGQPEQDRNGSRTTLNFLLSHPAAEQTNPFVVALMVRAITAVDPQTPELGSYVERLAELAAQSEDGRLTSWNSEQPTLYHAGGKAGEAENTSMAALALMASGQHPELVRGGLSWLVSNKDSQGTWFSTQPTILALKALLAGTDAKLGSDEARQFSVALDQHEPTRIQVKADQSEVVQRVDLTSQLSPGRHDLRLEQAAGADSSYQVVFSYHVPQPAPDPQPEPLSIALTYDRQTLEVNDVVSARASVVNHLPVAAPMVILDLPIPAGFSIDRRDLEALVQAGTIDRYEVNARSAVIYLRSLAPEEPLDLTYRLQATMPVRLTVPPAVVYEYYNPQQRGQGKPVVLEVRM